MYYDMFLQMKKMLGQVDRWLEAAAAHAQAKGFEGAATVTVSQPRWEGKTMTGHDYFLEHGVPNFFFHITTTYAILRHNGVSIGKRDYLGALTLHAPAQAAS